MKRFRVMVLAATLVYLGVAAIPFLVVLSVGQQQNHFYRIEIRRIGAAISDDSMELARLEERSQEGQSHIVQMNPSEYIEAKEVEDVSYLSAAITDPIMITEFYQSKNHYQMQIVPLYQDQKLLGYLRLDYQIKDSNTRLLLALEAILASVYLFVLGGMIALYYRILKPFAQFSELPQQLAKGNYDFTIKENKHRYFGRFLWGMGMLKDMLNEQKKNELSLNREKKMLLLTVSHDIKTPLNAIRLYAKAIEEGVYTNGKEQKVAAVKIQEKVLEIDGFVKTIMKSSQEEILSIQVNAKEEYYLKALVTDIQSGYEEKCRLRHLIFEVDQFEDQLLQGDLERMYQAIGNLIENAIKYGDGKKLQISFSEEEDCQLIHVINSGTPVEEAELVHLFESFYRGSNVEGKAGNGLGLYICSEIMHKMNGDIYAVRHSDGMEFVLVCQKA